MIYLLNDGEKSSFRKLAGFTLIELLVVIAITCDIGGNVAAGVVAGEKEEPNDCVFEQ